jgi:hypothetical protein
MVVGNLVLPLQLYRTEIIRVCLGFTAGVPSCRFTNVDRMVTLFMAIWLKKIIMSEMKLVQSWVRFYFSRKRYRSVTKKNHVKKIAIIMVVKNILYVCN